MRVPRLALVMYVAALVLASTALASAPAVVARNAFGYYSVSDDGRYVLSSTTSSHINLYDTTTGLVRRIASNAYVPAYISADGRRVVYEQGRRGTHPFGVLRSYSVATGRSRTIDASGRLLLSGLDPAGKVAAVEKFPTRVYRNLGTFNLTTKRFRRFPEPLPGFHFVPPQVALSNGGAAAVLPGNNKFGGENLLYVGKARLRQSGLAGINAPGAISTDGKIMMVNLAAGGIALLTPELTQLAVLPNARLASWFASFGQGSITADGQTAAQPCGTTLVLYSLATRHYASLGTIDGGNVRISGSGNRVFVEGPTGSTHAKIFRFDTKDSVDIGTEPPPECVMPAPRS
jgi:hypothetical protein